MLLNQKQNASIDIRISYGYGDGQECDFAEPEEHEAPRRITGCDACLGRSALAGLTRWATGGNLGVARDVAGGLKSRDLLTA